jgi:hypothetical protein
VSVALMNVVTPLACLRRFLPCRQGSGLLLSGRDIDSEIGIYYRLLIDMFANKG